jgi:hypothetical protein
VSIDEESTPARVLARTTERILFYFIKKCPISLSIGALLLPVRISTALNWEEVKLAFDQSYQFEITTDPLGSHYIIS